MEDKKYYTPDKKEIYPGYHCEIYEQATEKLMKDVRWHPVTVELSYNRTGRSIGMNRVNKLSKAGKLRTEYLTKRQIEAEGWIMSEKQPTTVTTIHAIEFYKEKPITISLEEKEIVDYILKDTGGKFSLYMPYKLYLFTQPWQNNKIWIIDTAIQSDRFNGNIRYMGQCKSVNELRTIEKWVGIK